MIPLMLVQRRQTWNGTFVPCVMQKPQQKSRRYWQVWSCTIRLTLPLSVTMWSRRTRGCFTYLYITWMGDQSSCLVIMPPPLVRVCILHCLYQIVKCLMMNQVAQVQWLLILCGSGVMVPITPTRDIMKITWWLWWNIPTRHYHWWKGMHSVRLWIILIFLLDL